MQLLFHLDTLEGDIKLAPNVVAIVAEGVKKKGNRPHAARGAVNDEIYLWTNGRVPYIIDSAFGKWKELESLLRFVSWAVIRLKDH